MHKRTSQVVSLVMAVAATASSIITTPAFGYETGGDVEESTAPSQDDIAISQDSGILSVKILSMGGQVVIDEGTEREQIVRLDKLDDGETYIDTYDKEGNLLLREEKAEDGFYTYEYDADTVNLKALADEGYVVWKFDVAEDGVSEETGFRREGLLEEYEFPLTVSADKDFYVSFVDAETAALILEEENADVTKDVTVKDKEDPKGDVTVGEEVSKGEDLTVEGSEESSSDKDVSGDLTVGEDLTEDLTVGNENPAEDGDLTVGDEEPAEDEDLTVGDEDPVGDEDLTVGDEDPVEDLTVGDEDPVEDLTVGDKDPVEDLTVGDKDPVEDEDLTEDGDLDSDISEDDDLTVGDSDLTEDGDMLPENGDLTVDDPDLTQDEDLTVDGSENEDPEDGDLADADLANLLKSSVSVVQNILTTGDTATLQVEAKNESETDAVLELYFCDGEEWDLEKPALYLNTGDSELPVVVMMNDGTASETGLKFYNHFSGDQITSSLASLDLPAGAEASFALPVSSDSAAVATVVPLIKSDEFLENAVYGEPASIAWEDEQHFLEKADGVDELDAEQFATARLIVLTDDIVDPENMIANYGNICLMQYSSVEQAMNAYVYYLANAEAVEPDVVLEAAEAITEPTEYAGISVTEENNPVAALSSENLSEPSLEENKVIALIDTGASAGPNIIDRVSLIDDVLNGGTHGDDMVRFIVDQNPGAKILSIRALGNDGYGSISAVISAIEYAINSQVDIINLSMYSKKTLATSVLESEIQKALDSGIMVVGSAGNDGSDVVDYVPGSIDGVWTIGSVDSEGIRKPISNYGDLVDYYVVSDSTSEAAARFTGYVSLFGIGSVPDDHTGLIFTEATDPGYDNDDIYVKNDDYDTTKTDDMIYDPVIENYVRENADPDYVGEGKLKLMNVMDVYATIASEEDLLPEDTIDTVSRENPKFLAQHTGRVPVYQMNDDSPYFVAFIDVMHYDSRARIADSIIAMNNVFGITIDDSYFDPETGLAYIPKDAFRAEDGSYYVDYVKAQILYALSDFNLYSQWNSAAVTVSEDADGEIVSDMEGDNVLIPYMTVQIGKHMDLDSMLVCVNGFPIEGNLYAYDPDSGLLSMGFSSALVQSVWVQAEKSADAPDVEPGMRAAYGAPSGSSDSLNTSTSFESMQPVADDTVQVELDKIEPGFSISTTASVYYSANSNHSPLGGNACGGTVIYSYQPSPGRGDSMVSWIMGSSSGQPTEGIGAWTGWYLFPFAVKLSSIGGADVDFNTLPSGLNMVMACTHSGASLGPGVDGGGKWSTVSVRLRCVAVNKTADKPWAVFAIFTQDINNQNGYGMFKIMLKGGSGGVKVTKILSDPKLVQNSERVYIDTEFKVYLDPACKKLYTNDTFNGVITLKGTDSSKSKAQTIVEDGLPVGDYYIKETGRCPGTINNQSIYKFTVVSGKQTSWFEDTKTKEKLQQIPNVPLRGKFKIIKKDEEGKASGRCGIPC